MRPWRGDDADWVCGACQDADIQRWTRVPVPYAMSDAEAFITTIATNTWNEKRGAHFAVVDATTGYRVGCVGLEANDLAGGEGEAGYWTAPAARGTGATTRALQLLTDWAFEVGGFVRLELLVEIENVKSIAVAERAGYRCEGVMVKKVWRHAAHRDVALFARTV